MLWSPWWVTIMCSPPANENKIQYYLKARANCCLDIFKYCSLKAQATNKNWRGIILLCLECIIVCLNVFTIILETIIVSEWAAVCPPPCPRHKYWQHWTQDADLDNTVQMYTIIIFHKQIQPKIFEERCSFYSSSEATVQTI